MKSPLYALLVAPEKQMREDILSGKKAISIREGHRDYQPGTSVMLCCHIEPWAVMADVTSVRHCRAIELTSGEIRADGFKGFDDCLTQMRRFYPTFGPDTLVTVIRWENVRGKLVELRNSFPPVVAIAQLLEPLFKRVVALKSRLKG